MSFLSALALAIGLFVAAPVAAHLLRRRQSGKVELPTAALLEKSPEVARRRAAVEDRALLGVRALAVLLLALLGATPFVSCSKLSLVRKDGGSVAIAVVVDDSLSMTADLGGSTRFDRAKRALAELVDDLDGGDSLAIVLAGKPARVHQALTGDSGALGGAVTNLQPSDRATDLEGALVLAADLLKTAPQSDRRVILLSDLADGNPEGAALDTPPEVVLWAPIPELTANGEPDCGVLKAERVGARVDVELVCSEGSNAKGRSLSINTNGAEVVRVDVPENALNFSLALPDSVATELVAELSAGDALRRDDFSPVVEQTTDFAIGVVSDALSSGAETGGPPPVERALSALDLGTFARPLTSTPEHEEELRKLSGLVLDDPPGLTPEERTAVANWVNGGGTLLLALGRRAAAAPLGSGLGDLVPGVVRWQREAPRGAAPDRCGFFGQSADGLTELAPNGRMVLASEAVGDAVILCAFADGGPLLIERRMGRGTVLISTLPFDLQSSDFALRPAFLTLIDRFAERARARGGARVVVAGGTFALPGVEQLRAALVLPGGRRRELSTQFEDGMLRLAAPNIGRYELAVGDSAEARFATMPATEVDLRPRKLAERALSEQKSGQAPKIDASPYVALALLLMMVLELLLRLWTDRGGAAATDAAGIAGATGRSAAAGTDAAGPTS